MNYYKVDYYKVVESDPSRGDFLHGDKFNSEEDAEEYIRGIVEDDDADTFGREFIEDDDYDYTDSPEYGKYKIVSIN